MSWQKVVPCNILEAAKESVHVPCVSSSVCSSTSSYLRRCYLPWTCGERLAWFGMQGCLSRQCLSTCGRANNWFILLRAKQAAQLANKVLVDSSNHAFIHERLNLVALHHRSSTFVVDCTFFAMAELLVGCCFCSAVGETLCLWRQWRPGLLAESAVADAAAIFRSVSLWYCLYRLYCQLESACKSAKSLLASLQSCWHGAGSSTGDLALYIACRGSRCQHPDGGWKIWLRGKGLDSDQIRKK